LKVAARPPFFIPSDLRQGHHKFKHIHNPLERSANAEDILSAQELLLYYFHEESRRVSSCFGGPVDYSVSVEKKAREDFKYW